MALPRAHWLPAPAALLALLAGCVAVAPSYNWAGYESELYGYSQGRDRGEHLAGALQVLIERAEARGQAVPPGLHAEYGYLLYRRGQIAAAVDMYRRELARWPESRQLVERLIADAVASDDAAAGAQPAAPPAASAVATRADPGPHQLHSIVVLPLAGDDVPATASGLFLAGALRPLSARGYYVFPVNVVRAVLAGEGYDRAQQATGLEPQLFRRLFGADAVLFVRVQSFAVGSRPGSPALSVELDYDLRDALSGASIWSSHRHADYVAPQAVGGGLAAAFDERVDATLFRLAPQYITLARGTSEQVMLDATDSLPPGPYAGAMGWLMDQP